VQTGKTNGKREWCIRKRNLESADHIVTILRLKKEAVDILRFARRLRDCKKPLYRLLKQLENEVKELAIKVEQLEELETYAQKSSKVSKPRKPK
jgi:hypothetical protein